ncbi:MAG: ATP-dependent zinc metalloprotease FtsH [Phycisphaerales bacterium]|nr:ATP-dependent zinc metalloprotease FtsH [Phycisphaerales bacterium]
MSSNENPQNEPGQDPQGNRPQNTPPPPPNRMGRGLLSWVIIIGILIVFFAMMNTGTTGDRISSWGQFKALVNPETGSVHESTLGSPDPVTIKNNKIVAIIAPNSGPNNTDKPQKAYVEIDSSNREFFRNELTEMGVDHVNDTATSIWGQLLLAVGPFLIIVLLIWFLIARSMRGAGGGPGGMLGSFGKSRHRISTKENTSVRFTDVQGIAEAKDEVQEIVQFLKNPRKFQRLGGRIPRGVLLVGPPGCGKTLLAKAIAGEAEAPFFSISGSDFVEMFVGVGASRVRDLFKQAKENSPCIIFLDEIDAVGRRRGGGFSSGGNDEREQTLNAILVEMDGFEATDQVIVIAATNRSDVLDPALTRPGRFDRQVHVSLPDLNGRYRILDVHSKKIKLAEGVELHKIARGTPGYSGADLAALINEAAILATLDGKDCVEQHDLEEARDKIRFGRERKSRHMEEEDRVLVAYHEAGHAVLQAILEDADPIHKVTIIGRGPYGGASFSLPEKDRHGYGRRWLDATLRVMCGGRIAEQKKVGDVSSGASMDIQHATNLARSMVLEWGMSERLGFVNYNRDDSRDGLVLDKDHSPETARIIDEEIKRLIDSAYDDATRLISENWEKIEALAQALLKYETLQSDEIIDLIEGRRVDRPTVSDLLDEESKATSDQPPSPSKTEDTDDESAGGLVPSPA